MLSQKTIYERCFHAVLFEILALLLCAPVVSMVLGVSMTHAGALTLMISLVAMTWNMISMRCLNGWSGSAAGPVPLPCAACTLCCLKPA